jgi:DNA (cytosine-5)-methyltransferase 1
MKKCVSLFSCAGFGDLGLEKAGIRTISACELVKERADLLQTNFPNTRVFNGDVWELQEDIINHALSELQGEPLFMMIISAPCQGASSNGIGRIKNQIKKGKRSKDDPRNRLILPAINIIQKLQPKFLVIENVPGMRHTHIKNEFDTYESILLIIARKLENYVLRSNVLNTADYGIPQTRKRLITLGIRQEYTHEIKLDDIFSETLSFLHPDTTHGDGKLPHVTLRNAIGHLPELDAVHNPIDVCDSFHCVPKWNSMQHFCMLHTPEGQTAFDNEKCAICHTINQNKKSIACLHCGSILPRPITQKNEMRIIKAFKTSYRRMWWDRPGNAITTNSGVISSDVKGHPSQNRVLSLREIMIVSSICSYSNGPESFEYHFPPSEKRLIRDVIGECIPPLLSYKIALHFLSLEFQGIK